MSLTPLVEPLSIDEAFLDLTGCEAANGAGAAETLARFARGVEREVGVTVSIGLSYCKFLAKLASDLEKPRGFAVAFARRGAGLARAPERLASVGRRQGRAGAAGAAGLSPDRRFAADRRAGGDPAPRRRRPAPVAAGAGARRAQGLAGARDEEHFQRDDVRPRHRRRGRADARPARPVRARRDPAAQGRPRRLRRDAEAAPGRFHASHAQPQRARRDATRAAPVRGGAPAARGAARRPRLSPAWTSPRPTSRRRQARTPTTTCSPATAAASASARRRSRLCARNSAPPPCSAASRSGRGQRSERAGPRLKRPAIR